MRARLLPVVPGALTTLACLAALAGLWGCGGSQATAAATTLPPQPAIPAEPLDMVPAGAQVVVRLDHAAVRAWSQYGRLTELARRADCDAAATIDAFGERTEVVAMAGFLVDGEQVEDLLVFRGDFAGMDAGALLDQAAELLDIPATAPGPKPAATAADATADTTARTAGDPNRAERGPLVAVRLDDHTLVAGAATPVDAAVALARGTGSEVAFSADPWVERMPFAGEAVVVYAHSDARSAGLLREQAASLGGAGLAKALEGASAGLSVRLRDGLRAAVQIDMATPQAAGDLLSETSRAIGQAELFLRMFQLPPLAQRLDLSVQDRTFLATLTLPEAEVAQLVQLLERVAELPACPAAPATSATAPTAPAASAAKAAQAPQALQQGAAER